MQTQNINDIPIDQSWYPRDKWSMSTVKTYADALLAGAQFPAITLDSATGNLLDGMHRLKAHEKIVNDPDFTEGYDDINLEDFSVITVEYHDIPEGIPAILYAAGLSSTHGDRLKAAEKKAVARQVCEANPDFTYDSIAQYLGVSLGSAHNYVKDIKARRGVEQQGKAMRLLMLGWTQQEVGDAVGMSRQWVDKFLPQSSELKIVAKTQLTAGLPHEEVAEKNGLPLQVVYAIDTEDDDDRKKMDKLGIKIQPYNVWNWSSCHDLFGDKHPGRIPGELIAHVLYFYTEQGDTVIDPMSGSGTTQDVCLTMGRRCYGYDIDDRHGREDVITHNIAALGWPDRVSKADLIFWDPPYFDKMDAGYVDDSISAYTREDYLDFFAQYISEAESKVKKGCKLAFVMSDWDDDGGEREGIFSWDYARIIEDAGWSLSRLIQAPLPTQLVHPDIVQKFRKSKRLARLDRYVIIAEKG